MDRLTIYPNAIDGDSISGTGKQIAALLSACPNELVWFAAAVEAPGYAGEFEKFSTTTPTLVGGQQTAVAMFGGVSQCVWAVFLGVVPIRANARWHLAYDPETRPVVEIEHAEICITACDTAYFEVIGRADLLEVIRARFDRS